MLLSAVYTCILNNYCNNPQYCFQGVKEDCFLEYLEKIVKNIISDC